MENIPKINWTHEMGPLLTCSDGTEHFLTLTEQLMFTIGVLTAEILDKEYNSNDRRG